MLFSKLPPLRLRMTTCVSTANCDAGDQNVDGAIGLPATSTSETSSLRKVPKDLVTTTSLSKKSNRKHVALSKVKMDCRCRKLSLFFCQFLSAVGESEKNCRHF